MRIWIHSLLILLIMLATLSIAPQLIVNHSINPNSTLLTPLFLTIIVSIIIALLMVKNVLKRLFITRGLWLLTIIISLSLWLISCLHTITAVQTALSEEIKQPIRVMANVRPIGISDSYYDTKSDLSYRQLAVIEKAEPLKVQHFKGKAKTINNQLPHLIGKKVLLSARFNKLGKKTKLPKGYSTDFTGLNGLQPTQNTTMMLEIQPIATQDKGFIHRWLRSRHINAQADILAYRTDFIVNTDKDWQSTLHQWRYNIRKHFIDNVGGGWQNSNTDQQQAQAVTLSLLTGDRALISKDRKYLYQLAGISHLLAISGTHVLFLAVILSALVTTIINRLAPSLYQRLSRSQLRWIVMVIGALCYALFTGFDVPSARTVYMLIGVGVTRLLIINISSRQVLLIIGVLMAIADPYILWQAGFWLSFVAVMVLISYDDGLNIGQNNQSEEDNSNLFDKFLPFLKLQLWIFIALLPLSLLLFGKVSLWGIVVNMVAIGLYGWIIVPINLLAGLIYLIIPSLATVLWSGLSALLALVHSFLGWLVGVNDPHQAWLYTNINASLLVVMGLVALPFVLPRSIISRVWTFPPLLLLCFLLFNQANPHNNQTTSVSVKLLQPYSKTISSVLLTSDDDNWLIIADHNKYAKNSNEQQAKQINQHLQEKLAQSGVDHLTGIIVQSPNKTLIKASELLKQSIPVGYLWQAGNKTLNPSNGSVGACDSGKQWHSDDKTLTIKAITGWQEIDNKAMWGCAIQIDSKEKIAINSAYQSHWAKVNEQPLQINTLQNNNLITKGLIINTNVTDDKLWHVWDLMCVDKDNNLQQAVLLNHSYSDLPAPLMNEINNVLLVDKADNSKQKLENMILDID